MNIIRSYCRINRYTIFKVKSRLVKVRINILAEGDFSLELGAKSASYSPARSQTRDIFCLINAGTKAFKNSRPGSIGERLFHPRYSVASYR